MAKIILQGNKEIEIPQNDALGIKEDMFIGKANGAVYEIGQITIRGRLINQVILDGEFSTNDEYNLDNPLWKEKVKDFEKEILSYFETAEYKTFENFLADKKIIKITRQRTHYADYDLIDGRVGEYDVYKKLWSGVNSLRVRRKYAGANPPLENLVEEKKRLEKKISYPKDEIDPAEMPF